MKNNVEKISDKCFGCSACSFICPTKAISMKENDEGFYFPHIEDSLCVNCGKCLNVCGALKEQETVVKVSSSHYGYINDEEVRAKSSSGGAFSALCEQVVKNGGKIVGATYDKDQKKLVHKFDTIENLRKSKYVESYMGDIISEINIELKKDMQVLFCGTPCQVAGVKNAIGENEKLITVDFICHGVPSMKILNEHMAYLSKKYHKKISGFDFRPKTRGWSIHQIKYIFDDGTKKEIVAELDSYFQGFFKNIFLRKSCYDCKFCISHYADITLADFWGIYKYKPEQNDEKGFSLLLLNTKKGEVVFEQSENNMTIYPIEVKDAIYCLHSRNNLYNMKSRDQFFNSNKKFGFEKAAKENYFKKIFIKNLKWKIKDILNQ